MAFAIDSSVNDDQLGKSRIKFQLQTPNNTAGFEPGDWIELTRRGGLVRTFVFCEAGHDVASGDTIVATDRISDAGSNNTAADILGATFTTDRTCIAVVGNLAGAADKNYVLGNAFKTTVLATPGFETGWIGTFGTFSDTASVEAILFREESDGYVPVRANIAQNGLEQSGSGDTVVLCSVVNNAVNNHALWNQYATDISPGSGDKHQLLIIELMQQSMLPANSTNTTILEAEYEANFLPALRSYKKKVK